MMSSFQRAALLDAADWSFPIPIHYGPGRIAGLGQLCKNADVSRALVVTDRGSRSLPFIDAALDSLTQAGVASTVFSDVSPNPTDADIAAGRTVFREGGHDAVIAMGGGSGMDGGKAISLVAHNDKDLWAFDYDLPVAPDLTASDFPFLVCIPTTAGTGAETQSTAMVTDLERGVKRCVWHAAQTPRAAILDPELTLGLPANLTAWTGVDAYVHAIEAVCVPAWHPLCDGAALEALRLIHRWLPDAVADGANVEARGAMLVGSCLAGISFLKGLGLVHAMSHMIGAVHDTHHGVTNAVLLPGVLRYNRPAIKEESARMCQAILLPEADFDNLYRATVALLDTLEIPRSLAAIGVGDQRLGEIAIKAHGDAARATNPRLASVPDIEALLREAFKSAR